MVVAENSASLVNAMFSAVLSMVCNTFSISFVFTIANASSTYRLQKLMSLLVLVLLVLVLVLVLVLTVFFSRSCNSASARKVEIGEGVDIVD